MDKNKNDIHTPQALQSRLPDQVINLPTAYGTFKLQAYLDPKDNKEHLALVNLNQSSAAEAPLVRIHSECLTGDTFASQRCDCGPQLESAMRRIAKEGGALIYLRQEGRGIGLMEKLKAYALQEQGYDTVEANEMLGHQPDARSYLIAAQILSGLGIGKVRLITNNPDKIASMEQYGITVTERIASPTCVTEDNREYLNTKITKFRHMIKGC